MITWITAFAFVIGYNLSDSFWVGAGSGVIGCYIGMLIDDARNASSRKEIREDMKLHRASLDVTEGSSEKASKIQLEEKLRELESQAEELGANIKRIEKANRANRKLSKEICKQGAASPARNGRTVTVWVTDGKLHL